MGKKKSRGIGGGTRVRVAQRGREVSDQNCSQLGLGPEASKAPSFLEAGDHCFEMLMGAYKAQDDLFRSLECLPVARRSTCSPVGLRHRKRRRQLVAAAVAAAVAVARVVAPPPPNRRRPRIGAIQERVKKPAPKWRALSYLTRTPRFVRAMGRACSARSCGHARPIARTNRRVLVR